MAMASSGIGPLARLQTGSKGLRARRELCQVAAKEGFKAETGEKLSTHKVQRTQRSTATPSLGSHSGLGSVLSWAAMASIGKIISSPSSNLTVAVWSANTCRNGQDAFMPGMVSVNQITSITMPSCPARSSFESSKPVPSSSVTTVLSLGVRGTA